MKRLSRRKRAEASPSSVLESGSVRAPASADTATVDASGMRVEGDHNRLVGPGGHHNNLGDVHYEFHLQGKVDPPDRPRPVPQWTAQQLNIHAAVPGDVPNARSRFALPAYVRRPHDDELRHRLNGIRSGQRAELVVVRGGSCVGKTRTAYEAVKECLADWQLLYPKSAQSIILAHKAGLLTERTVLWLDNAHQLFFEPEGEQAAATVQSLLEENGPIAVIATIWPEEYRALTAHPAPRAGQDELKPRPDPHGRARDLLGSSALITVPDAFTEPQMGDLRRLARVDPALEMALDWVSAPSEVTQTLAAGPELLDRWVHATNPYGGAVLTAAIDARRLGVRSMLPAEFLRGAAPVYLVGKHRINPPEDWFDQALAYGLEEVKDVAGALQLVPRTDGMGAQPGVFDLADYLQERAASQRRGDVPADPFWRAALDHLDNGADLDRMGTQAFNKSRFRWAERLCLRAAELGHAPAVESLCHLYTETGHILLAATRDRLLDLARGADDGGYSLWYVGSTLASIATEPESEPGLAAVAGAVLIEAFEAGSMDAVHAFKELCRDQGVDASAFVRQAEQKRAAEQPREALSREVAVLRAAAGGDADSVAAFEHLVADRGQSFRALVRYGATDQSLVILGLSLRMRKAGGQDAFEVLLRAVADTGAWHAVSGLASYLYQTDRDDEADEVLTQAWTRGDEDAWVMLCSHLISRDFAKARSLIEQARREGRGRSVVRVVRPLLGRQPELIRFAETTLRELADDGEPSAQFELSKLLFLRWCDKSRNHMGEVSNAGDMPEQIECLLMTALPHVTQAYWLLGQMAEVSGDVIAAQRWYRGAVDRSDSECLPLLARVLVPSDDAQEQLIRMGLEADGSPSPPW